MARVGDHSSAEEKTFCGAGGGANRRRFRLREFDRFGGVEKDVGSFFRCSFELIAVDQIR